MTPDLLAEYIFNVGASIVGVIVLAAFIFAFLRETDYPANPDRKAPGRVYHGKLFYRSVNWLLTGRRPCGIIDRVKSGSHHAVNAILPVFLGRVGDREWLETILTSAPADRLHTQSAGAFIFPGGPR